MENKETQNYIKDINEIRSIMERSTKFMPLSGWAGILAGVYALIGVYIAYYILNFNPVNILYYVEQNENIYTAFSDLIILALTVLVLTLITVVFLSYNKSKKRGENIWNSASRRLIINMAVPLITGGFFILILIPYGLIGLIPSLTLLFYGLALFNAGKFTYKEVRILGLIQIILGLFNTLFIELGLLFWALGFGAVNIIYGIYMHFRYER